MYGPPSDEPQPFTNPDIDSGDSSSEASPEALAAHKKKPSPEEYEVPEDNPIS